MGSGDSAGSQAGPRAAGVAWHAQPWTSAMADLAEAVDDLICSFDYADTAMDSLVMLGFAALVVVLATLAVARFLYGKYASTPKLDTSTAATTAVKPIELPAVPIAKDIEPTAIKLPAKSTVKSKPTPFVPSTPPATRKRLSRMSPGPSLDLPSKKSNQTPVPTSTGSDPPSVQWVNQVLMWLYSDIVIVNELVQTWIVSMNEFSKKSVDEHGIGLEIVRALDSHSPQISNVFAECDTKDDVTITCDCEATPAFQLKAFRQKGEKVDVSHYRANVNRFRARLSILCITDKLTGELRCDGWPDVKVALAPVGPLKANADESNLRDLVSEIVVSALRSTHFEFNLSQFPTCPRLKRYVESPGRTLPLHYDSMLSQDRMYTSTPMSAANHPIQPFELQRDKRLLVKVVGAKDLGGSLGCSNPYCIVDMDEPSQKNQTAVKKDTNSPFWDEHFLFDLSPSTAEILFEVYDRGQTSQGQSRSNIPGSPVTSHRFLGLGIVGIEELLVSPSQRQLISLQSRPMEDEDVSGVLTVEFLFIEGADVPVFGNRPFKLKETLRTTSPTGQTLTTTRTTFEQNGQNSTRLTESALKELQRSPSTTANKSTLIIHSVQRQTPKQIVKVERNEAGEFIEVESRQSSIDHVDSAEVKTETDPTIPTEDEVESKPSNGSVQSSPQKLVTISENPEPNHIETNSPLNGLENMDKIDSGENKQGDYAYQPPVSGTNGLPQHAPRDKKRRDFFGTIKRRWRSKNRSKSTDLPDSEIDEAARVRSVSADRNAQNEALSVPGRLGGRNVYSAGASPAQSGDESRTSRRSSLSEMSGVSAASARTFVHEASTLVLETMEAGVQRHYLVPMSIAQRPRWRRKGIKLHIYNDHTFVAKHISGGIVCQICNKNIARRIGKQGYECRDCLLKCHKHCHVKVTEMCMNTTIHSMELLYIRNPLTDPNIKML